MTDWWVRMNQSFAQFIRRWPLAAGRAGGTAPFDFARQCIFNRSAHNLQTQDKRNASQQHSKSKNQTKHFIAILLVRYLCLAILTATAATTFSQSVPESADNNSNDMARQLAGDFDWDIQPEDGYTSIA
jgi:hypothetical protein